MTSLEATRLRAAERREETLLSNVLELYIHDLSQAFSSLNVANRPKLYATLETESGEGSLVW